MNRRGFLKGAVLSAIAGVLGIGAKASKKRSAIHAKSGDLYVNGLLVAGEGAKTTLAPCPSPEFESEGTLSGHGVLVSEELVADAEFQIPPPYPVQWVVKDFELGSWTGNATAEVS